jgi:hypothetical protein
MEDFGQEANEYSNGPPRCTHLYIRGSHFHCTQKGKELYLSSK